MKRFAAVAASARRAIARASVAAALTVGFAGIACAGDRALLDVIGYSPDARYFAFEEFGIQDGSGFPYANVYVIDVETDGWAPGTPVRVRIEDEAAGLADARREARTEAKAALTAIEAPADVWALVGDGEMDAEAKTLDFGRPSYERGAVIESYRLDLETFEAPAGEPCQDWFEQAPLGYALTLAGPDGERLVHRDERVPRSRGCPFDYRIHAIVAPMDAPDLEAVIAILSVYPGGFEGPDRRFLAVPLGH
ncbi:DUF2259 domain-containing protein [Devosia nitrariae]|uniref:DUF2259 domain-containing protein n=1 Tax=Devosia nitrariae TaxID=2071872 RepID=A0ABQ5W087_9HYPH|nr:DUF2259 domain-containing protein [Devosia nitrariae]GLQ53443.1 hypothetical protein GCM10010862_07010 [Devosia nitrariae]